MSFKSAYRSCWFCAALIGGCSGLARGAGVSGPCGTLVAAKQNHDLIAGIQAVKPDLSLLKSRKEEIEKLKCDEAHNPALDPVMAAARDNALAVTTMVKQLVEAGYVENKHFIVERGSKPGDELIQFLPRDPADGTRDSITNFVTGASRTNSATVVYWPFLKQVHASGSAALFLPGPRIIVVSELIFSQRVSHYEHHESMHAVIHRLRRSGREGPYLGSLTRSETFAEVGEYEHLSFDELAAYPHGMRFAVEALRPGRPNVTTEFLRETVRGLEFESSVVQLISYDMVRTMDKAAPSIFSARSATVESWVQTGGDARPEVIDVGALTVTRSKESTGITVTVRLAQPGLPTGTSEMTFDLIAGREPFDVVVDKAASSADRKKSFNQIIELLDSHMAQLRVTALLANQRSARMRLEAQEFLNSPVALDREAVYQSLRFQSQQLVAITSKNIVLK